MVLLLFAPAAQFFCVRLFFLDNRAWMTLVFHSESLELFLARVLCRKWCRRVVVSYRVLSCLVLSGRPCSNLILTMAFFALRLFSVLVDRICISQVVASPQKGEHVPQDMFWCLMSECRATGPVSVAGCSS